METYRVTIIRVEEPDGVPDEVVVLQASREQLARFAPGVVAEALGATEDRMPELPTEAVKPFTPAAATETDGNYGPGQPAKRKRRTRAEMEADAAREKAAADIAKWPTPDEVAANHKALDTADAPEPAAAMAPDAVPYNPFLPK